MASPDWSLIFDIETKTDARGATGRMLAFKNRAGADAEARRLMEIAHTTGTLELRPDAPTLRSFVDDTFKPLFRANFGRVLGSVTREFSAKVFSTSLVTSRSTKSQLRWFEHSWRFLESAASNLAAP